MTVIEKIQKAACAVYVSCRLMYLFLSLACEQIQEQFNIYGIVTFSKAIDFSAKAKVIHCLFFFGYPVKNGLIFIPKISTWWRPCCAECIK